MELLRSRRDLLLYQKYDNFVLSQIKTENDTHVQFSVINKTK
nr:MAG TPA: hypothetical protein [Caudoviricetes sp.]